jgi:hypothetical protein
VHDEIRIEWRLGGAVGNKLEPDEQSPSPYVADIGMIAEAIGQQSLQSLTRQPDALEKAFVLDDTLDGKRRGAAHRMRVVSLTVL